MNFNLTIFQYIYGLSHHASFLDKLGVFFASYSQYVLCGILIILLFFPRAHRSKNANMLAVSIISILIARLGIKSLILLLYPHPRPFVSLSWVYPLITTNPSENLQSFPSGHALFFFALAGTLFSFNKKLGAWYFLAALVMGIARIYVGVHWPSDILGGMVIGTLTGWLISQYYLRNEDRIKYFLFKRKI